MKVIMEIINLEVKNDKIMCESILKRIKWYVKIKLFYYEGELIKIKFIYMVFIFLKIWN